MRDQDSALSILAAVSRHQQLCANEALLGAFGTVTSGLNFISDLPRMHERLAT